MASNAFRLKCLGGLTLESDDVVIPAAALQRRRLALLVLLARAGEIGMTRDRVMGLLWPEAPADSARHALDQLLYTTRRDLGKSAVISDGMQLRLNREVITSDVAEFERLLRLGDGPAAIEHYAGPFLDGVHVCESQELENWVSQERAVLLDAFLNALEQCATSAQNPKRALHWWKRRMAAEPFSESAAVALLRAYAAVGDYAGARRYADSYRALVEAELGDAPSKAFEACVAEIAASASAKRPLLRIPLPVRTQPLWWSVAVAVVLVLFAGSRAASHRRPHLPTPEAEALFRQGRIYWNERSREGLAKAVVLLRQAVERDPLYGDAYAGLAEAYALLGYHGFMPAGSAFPKAEAAAQQALELTPASGAAYTALGIVLQWKRDWRGAEQAFKRALELDPKYATAHQHHALLLRTLRREREAVVAARTAAELDPLSIQISNTYAITLSGSGQRDSALIVYERIVGDEPDTAWVRRNPWVLSNYGALLAQAGASEKAIALLQRAIDVVPRHPRPLDDLAAIYLARGDTARAIETFDRADKNHPLYPAYRAFFFGRLGQADSAFAWFDRIEEWSPMVLMKLNTITSRALVNDPRYFALRRRLKLPD